MRLGALGCLVAGTVAVAAPAASATVREFRATVVAADTAGNGQAELVYPPKQPPHKPYRPPHKPPHRPPHRPHHRPPHRPHHHVAGGLPFTGAAVATMTAIATALVVLGLALLAIRRRGSSDAGR
jgi:hypothetical protein